MQIIDPLLLDLVEWIAQEPRSHAEVMDALRTSCPRLTVWEEAVEQGLVQRSSAEGRGAMVIVTAAGQRALRRAGRVARASAQPQQHAAE